MTVPVDAEGPIVAPGAGATPSQVSWPEGPHYFDLTGSDGGVAWVRYRVWAADWYTQSLRTVAGSTGSYDRLVGIEMALDGALNSLSGAFDAATGLLIRSAETSLDVDVDDRVPVYRYSWGRARSLLSLPAIGTDPDLTANDEVWRVIVDVDNALADEDKATPSGWLAQLRRLRNQLAHQDSLARVHTLGRPSSVRALAPKGGSPGEALARACDQVHDLTEPMINLAIRLGAHHVHGDWRRPRWFPLDG